ncbi:MAG: hypothetical protein GTO17_00810 [Candidatus Aminicenantes bacterium]|nr:hypothetical protein [Candidatus Aminicenantes bacterium]
MKKYFWIILLSLFFTASCMMYLPYWEEVPPEEPYDYYGELDTGFFYDYLSPYGSWIYYSPYGYVWTPYSPGYGWRPYTRGHWVWTDYGWTWISDLRWGWACFHYGRWAWDRGLGWFWVPGTTWGPAWVTWRWSNTYIGWAPLPPDIGFVGLRIVSLPYVLPNTYWIFIDGRYFMSPYVYRYVLPFERNVTIINYTVIRTNIYIEDYGVVNRGVDPDHIRRVTRRSISKYDLREASQPGVSKIVGNGVEIYRPSLKVNQAAKPKKVLSKREAEAKISEGTVAKPGRKEMSSRERSRLKDRQEQEMRLLERSQRKEVKDIELKFNKEKKSVKGSSEKTAVEEKQKVTLKKLKRQHETEKSKITNRHTKERAKAVKKKVEKAKKEEDKKAIKKRPK